jgi:predicted nucleic acid-binding protein
VSLAILDTTVVLHIFRKYPPAVAWFRSSQTFAVVSTTWMEVMVGVSSKRAMQDTLNLLNNFQLFYLTDDDQQWAQNQLQQLRFSHHVTTNDCLIASVAHRLQIPLYTHNLKDMTPMLGNLAIKPYV